MKPPQQQSKRGETFEEFSYKQLPVIEISPDRMIARVKFPPMPLCVDIFNLLAEAGVCSGIDTMTVRELNQMLTNGERLEETYIVARGREPSDGMEGELILRSTRPQDVILSSDELVSVDYRIYKQKQLALAEMEQPIAMIINPTEGRDGVDVTGKSVPAKPGQDVKLDLGRNVYISGKKVISRIDGLVEYGRVNGIIYLDVSQVYIVKEDVDFTTGNIDFPGSVIVNGSIKAGFQVRARNEVIATTIRGRVIAGGGVTARQGIIGGQEAADIYSEGSVYAKFVHKAKIITNEGVYVKKSIMASEIYAEKEVIVDGAPGSIIGGKIFSVKEISAKVYGSESYVKTEVAIFTSVKDVVDMKKLVAQRFETSKMLNKLENYLGNNKEILMRQGESKRAMIDKLLRKREQMRKEIASLDSMIKELQGKLVMNSTGRIEVQRHAYPEVKFMIGGRFVLTTEKTKRGTYYFDKKTEEVEFR
ncbi:DUF342 domain-containing protein [Seleniivibrio woodruffii]|uniref:DUF342 domain-containing protein n=1 Tax=Seleniivibrio woodruffii TaxID=1078050 RepID=UPI002409F49D|nr:FapA family protein [Seleniivibrio woodruffii]